MLEIKVTESNIKGNFRGFMRKIIGKSILFYVRKPLFFFVHRIYPKLKRMAGEIK